MGFNKIGRIIGLRASLWKIRGTVVVMIVENTTMPAVDVKYYVVS